MLSDISDFQKQQSMYMAECVHPAELFLTLSYNWRKLKREQKYESIYVVQMMIGGQGV